MSTPVKIDVRLQKRLPALGESEAFDLNIYIKSDACCHRSLGGEWRGQDLGVKLPRRIC